MEGIEPMATRDDYESAYGPLDADGAARIDGLLLRATGYLLSYLDGYERGDDPVLDLNAATVCCAMAHRALCAPEGMEGVSQYSQTAGSYSASVSMLDQYMRPLPSELEMLGAGDGCVVAVARMVPGGGAR